MRHLPAYGRELKRARDAGDHPERVWVLAGDDWTRRPTNAPSLAIGGDWRPGEIDWHVVAGVPVHIVDREHPHLFEIAAEVARKTAPVVVHWHPGDDAWPYAAGRPAQIEIDAAALAERAALDGRWTWPHWWSDDLDAVYAARRRAFILALQIDIERSSAA